MKLYYTPGTSSLSPHIALRETGLPFELERVDIATKKTDRGDDYRVVNPKAYTPALLLESGALLTEGAVIVQYIADLKPEARLIPPVGSLERVRLQEWLHYIATELHKPTASLYLPGGSDYKQAVQVGLVNRFGLLARTLGDRAYLLGDQFTVADGYAYYALRFWKVMAQVQLREWSALAAFYDRVSARPSVIAALQAEGLSA
jgi:glutathione S-transferase